jgi:hypothetical protein
MTLTFLFQLSAQDTTKYFPFQIGNKWIYKITDGLWSPGYDIVRLGDTLTAMNRKCWKMTSIRIDASASKIDTVRLDINDNLLWLHEATEDTLYRFSTFPGDSWTYFIQLTDSTPIRRKVTFLGVRDSYAVSEGPMKGTTFYNIKIFSSDVPGHHDFYETSYFAPNFGLIYRFWFGMYQIITGGMINGKIYGDTTLTSLIEVKQITSSSFLLLQNYPNPFNPSTHIIFSLPKEGRVKIKVFDILGREIIELSDKMFVVGEHEVNWDARDNKGYDVPSGVYFSRLEFYPYEKLAPLVENMKMILIR